MSCPGRFSTSSPPSPPYSPSLQEALRYIDNLHQTERSQRTASRLESRRHRGVNLPTRELLSRLNAPQKHFKSVHVTGSKGKGSVSALICAALMCTPFKFGPPADYSVGLFSSPHVERFTERVRLNTKPLDDDILADALHTAFDARNRTPRLDKANWFDIVAAGGMLALCRQNASRVVVEVGMGGRLDATNVLDAQVSVITNIQLEHPDVIGPTLRDIAYEKAGVIARGAKVVIGMSDKDPLADVFQQEAASLYPRPSLEFVPPRNGDTLFQANLRIARAAVHAVAEKEAIQVDADSILSEDLAHSAISKLPGRQEAFRVQCSSCVVEVLLDGAHVPDSVEKVLNEMDGPAPVAVLAMSQDKDIMGIGKKLKGSVSKVFVTEVGKGYPFSPAENTADGLKRGGVAVCHVINDPFMAFRRAIEYASLHSCGVVVMGSFSLVGLVRERLRNAGLRNALPEGDESASLQNLHVRH